MGAQSRGTQWKGQKIKVFMIGIVVLRKLFLRYHPIINSKQDRKFIYIYRPYYTVDAWKKELRLQSII